MIRYYFDIKKKHDLALAKNIMNEIYRKGSVPYSRGSFFETEFSKTKEFKKMTHIINKYNVTEKLSSREQIVELNVYNKIIVYLLKKFKRCDLW